MVDMLSDIVCKNIINLPSADPSAFPHSFGILASSWLPLTFIALFASILALTALFMVANFLRNTQLISWVKFEFFQVFGTITLVVFSIAWVVGMCNFNLTFLNDPVNNLDYTGKNMYKVADDYFTDLGSYGRSLFMTMMYVSKIITLMQKITYFSSPAGLGVTDTPLDSVGQLNSVLFFTVSGFTASYLLNYMQMISLQYMAYASLYYMFPFGIFFRAFEPTRAFGGALIGIAMGFFLFYPIAIGFNDYIMKPNMDATRQDLASGELATAKNNIASADPNYPTEEQAGNGAAQLNDPNFKQNFSTGVGASIIFLLKPVAFYVMGAVMLPVLNYVVLVEIIKGLTKIFGEELDVSNLTRLI